MFAAGYRYINIDDLWATGRDLNGTLVASASRFPSGMAALATYVHSKGLSFGLYTDVGTKTCGGSPVKLLCIAVVSVSMPPHPHILTHTRSDSTSHTLLPHTHARILP